MFAGSQIKKRNQGAMIEESQFPKALSQNFKLKVDIIEDAPVCPETCPGSRAVAWTELLQSSYGLAFSVFLQPVKPITFDLYGTFCRQSIDNRGANSIQTSRNFIV